MRVATLVAILCGAATGSVAEEHIVLDAVAQGRYLLDIYGTSFCSTGPTPTNPFSEFDAGQDQAAYASFDTSSLSGTPVTGVSLSFTQTDVHNTYAFPLELWVWDVSTSFDRLIIDRNPLDEEGFNILADLRGGNPYASFVATAEATGYQIPLNGRAIFDLQTAINNEAGHFSIGLANSNFLQQGYLEGEGLKLEVIVETTSVSIDVKPSAFPNVVYPGSAGLLPVAVLTTPEFDATLIDPLTVRLGVGKAVEIHQRGHIEDVDGDGDRDLLLHFEVGKTGIQCGDTSVSLGGRTFDGQVVTGHDTITTVGCVTSSSAAQSLKSLTAR
jgi:hypothetical protein